jgi:hypothetical protein
MSDMRTSPEGRDPLDVFRRLPEPRIGAADVDAMKSAVAELRRARQLASEPRYAWAFAERRAAASRFAMGWRAAAVMALVLLPTAMLDGPPSAPGVGMGIAQADLQEMSAAAQAVAASHTLATALPLVEDIDPRTGSVLQIEDEWLSVVVVAD